MKVIVLNGYPKSGKTTFAEKCQLIRPGKIYNISMIDAVKTAARAFDWNHHDKTDRARKFLSDLKDVWTEFNDGPYETIKWRIETIKNLEEMKNQDSQDLIVFVDAREPDDIERLVNDYNAFTILIRRPGVERTHGNHADDCVEDWGYDMIYDNEGNLEDMEVEARMILNYIDNNAKEAPEE